MAARGRWTAALGRMHVAVPIIEIDGAEFSTLDEFFQHFSDRALDGAPWGKNLDAFNDVLRGGFGTPDSGFKLLWRNHTVSRARLGYPETIRQLQKRLAKCHPGNRACVQADLDEALRGRGSTAFDWLIEIIRAHGKGGAEEDDHVELVLE